VEFCHIDTNFELKAGNAPTDSSRSGGWLISNFEDWVSGLESEFDPRVYGLRNDGDVEIKWALHPKGETRPDAWAPCSKKTGVSILLSGQFVVFFRAPDDHTAIEKIELQNVGDYVIWRETLEHRWHAKEDSVVLTVRWMPQSRPLPPPV
jgi:hypothetical protein